MSKQTKQMKQGLYPAGHRFQTHEFREAAAKFMQALWDNEGRRALMRSTMTTIWDEFKQEPAYEELRQGLSRAAKRRKMTPVR